MHITFLTAIFKDLARSTQALGLGNLSSLITAFMPAMHTLSKRASVQCIASILLLTLISNMGPTAQAAGASTTNSAQAPVSPQTTHASQNSALPQGGQVVQGEASISSAANTTTIHQTSQNASINWNSFNIGNGQSVNFIQPNASAIALNRIVGQDPSSIYGSLNANGKVFLINPNGILFSPSASVNVGGLVASTLNISDQNLMSGKYVFTANGTGSITNQGTITAADGSYVALLGAQVNNTGTINAHLGSIAMAAGQAMTLDLGDGLMSVAVNAGTVKALVQNGGVIQANGGNVVLTTQAAGEALQTAVNNTGTIQAQSVQNVNGTIRLLGDMKSGTVNVGGKLDASAPKGGNGGNIETSAASVKVANNAQITSAAPKGKPGNWLIDPNDYVVATTGGDITPTTLATALSSTNVTIQSSDGSGTSLGGNGDIAINAPVAWSANTLILNANRNININAPLTGTGTASLFLQYGQGGSGNYYVNAPITLPENLSPTSSSYSFATQSYNASPTYFAVISSASGLQNLESNQTSTLLATSYALGANVDASTISSFTPIGSASTPFTGTFEGLGNKISNLNLSSSGNTTNNNSVGLFGYIGTGGVVQNLGVVNPTIVIANDTGSDTALGGLAGTNAGTINNVYVAACITSNCTSNTSSIYSSATNTGGLVGVNLGTVSNSFATIPVTSSNATNTSDNVGGLVGINTGTIQNSFATGSVTGMTSVGGLVGFNGSATDSNNNSYGPGTISQSYATGAVASGSTGSAGGLVGINASGTIQYVYATGTASGNIVGGLVGYNTGTIQYSYASGASTASDNGYAGGLVGVNADGTVNTNYATGSATVNSTALGNGNAGGLIGYNTGSGTYSSNYASGTASVTSLGTSGSLVGYDDSIASSVANSATAFTLASTAGSYTSALTGNSLNYFAQVNSKDILTSMPLQIFAVTTSKTYDGTTSSTASPTVIGLQTTAETISATQQYTDPSAGTSKLGLISAYTIKDASSSSSSSANYSVSTSSDASGTINTAPLTLTISKTYDGTTAFTTSNSYSLSGTVTGDTTPTLSGSGATSSANAATYTSLSSSSFALNNSNYSIQSTVAATIAPAPLSLSISKTYDGTTTFTNSNIYSLSGMINGESSPTISSGTAATSSANASSYSGFSSNTLALSNSNYTITGGTISATINQAPLNLTMSKTYDGTTTFTNANSYSLSGTVSGDATPTISSGSAATSSSSAATYSSFSSNTLALSNSNYTLLGGTISATIHSPPLPDVISAHSAGLSESQTAVIHEANMILADANEVEVDPVSGRVLPPNEHLVQGLPSTTVIAGGVRLPRGLAVKYEVQAAR